jgi:hypothetical protein
MWLTLKDAGRQKIFNIFSSIDGTFYAQRGRHHFQVFLFGVAEEIVFYLCGDFTPAHWARVVASFDPLGNTSGMARVAAW